MNDGQTALYEYWRSLLMEEQRNAERNRRLLKKLNDIEQRTNILNKRTERLAQLRSRFASMIREQYLDSAEAMDEKLFAATTGHVDGCKKKNNDAFVTSYNPPEYIPDPLMFGVTTPPWVLHENDTLLRDDNPLQREFTHRQQNSEDYNDPNRGDVDEESDEAKINKPNLTNRRASKQSCPGKTDIAQEAARRRSIVAQINKSNNDLNANEISSPKQHEQDESRPCSSSVSLVQPNATVGEDFYRTTSSLDRQTSTASSGPASPNKDKAKLVQKDVSKAKKEPMHHIIQPGPSILKPTEKNTGGATAVRRTSFRRRSSSATPTAPIVTNNVEATPKEQAKNDVESDNTSKRNIVDKRRPSEAFKENASRRSSQINTDKNTALIRRRSSQDLTDKSNNEPQQHNSSMIPVSQQLRGSLENIAMTTTQRRNSLRNEKNLSEQSKSSDDQGSGRSSRNSAFNNRQQVERRSSSLSRQRRLEQRRSQNTTPQPEKQHPQTHSSDAQTQQEQLDDMSKFVNKNQGLILPRQEQEEKISQKELQQLQQRFEAQEREKLQGMMSDGNTRIDQFSYYLPANMEPGMSMRNYKKDIHTPDLDGILLNKTMSMLIAEERRRASTPRVETQEEMTQTSVPSPPKDAAKEPQQQRRPSFITTDLQNNSPLLHKRESEMDISLITGGRQDLSPSDIPQPDLALDDQLSNSHRPSIDRQVNRNGSTKHSETDSVKRKKKIREKSRSRGRDDEARRSAELNDLSTASSSRSSSVSSRDADVRQSCKNESTSKKNSDLGEGCLRQMMSDSFFDSHSKLTESSAYKQLLGDQPKPSTSHKMGVDSSDDILSSQDSNTSDDVEMVPISHSTSQYKKKHVDNRKEEVELPSNASTPPAYAVPSKNVKELITTKVKHDVPSIISKKVMGLDLYANLEAPKRRNSSIKDDKDEEDSFFE